jgi:predicted transglutaminase-like cysteine proteinase
MNHLINTLKRNVVVLLMCGIVFVCIGLAHALNADKLRTSMRNLGGKEAVLNEWFTLMQTAKTLTEEERLQKVNQFFNRRIIYTEDLEAWGQSDYWATPIESLAKAKGDCEDFVIAKYFTLLNLGIAENQLRLIYVKARLGGVNSQIQQAHMVLAYYPNMESDPLILDNLINDIRSAARRPDLTPVFSFNGQGVFAGAAANASLGQGGVSRLSKWQNLLERARNEGFE